MNLPTSIASTQHNHDRCIAEAMTSAKALCSRNGARMTALRERVLRLIWQSHKPLGAYTLLEMLSQESSRRAAPPTVYRALDFLMEQGLIHRINSLNAYVGCTHPSSHHANNFLICQQCGVAIEFSAEPLQNSIKDLAEGFNFTLQTQSIELSGLCSTCQEASL